MLEFKKYNSIENTYNKDFMDRIKLEGYDSLQFVVQEKVHGANCCFVTNGETVQFAKRTGWVEVGEMFGGKYPHPDVSNDTKVMCIQKDKLATQLIKKVYMNM